MGIDLYRNDLKKRVTGFIASSKDWEVGTRYRRQVNISDGGTTQNNNLIIVDMSGWGWTFPAADLTNYVRVYEYTDATEAGVEVNSQCIDSTWAGGNHDSVCFLLSDTSTKTQYVVYYGDTDLGATGYTSDLTVTADAPAAGDYTIVQDSYYTIHVEIDRGGIIEDIWTRVSGGDVRIGRTDFTKIGNSQMVVGGVTYGNRFELGATISLVEGSTGANAGAVLVAIKSTGVMEDAANNPLQDDSAGNVTYEMIFIFCNNQMFQVRSSVTSADTISNVTQYGLSMAGNWSWLNGYFSHQSYKYSTTQAEEAQQTRDLSAQYANRVYQCYFDPTSNDGVAGHFMSETLNMHAIEDADWFFTDAGATDNWGPSGSDFSGDNDTYSAGTDTEVIWVQVDDFTADVAATEVTAQNKSLEVQSTVTDATLTEVGF